MTAVGNGATAQGNGNAGRNPDGRFGVGNRAAAGHVPATARTMRLCEMLDTSIGNARWRRIIEVLATRAEDGDMEAIKELLNRRFGRPRQTLDADTAPPGGGLHITITRPDWEPPPFQIPPRVPPPGDS